MPTNNKLAAAMRRIVGGSGSGSLEAIKEAVNAYLDENPVSAGWDGLKDKPFGEVINRTAVMQTNEREFETLRDGVLSDRGVLGDGSGIFDMAGIDIVGGDVVEFVIDGKAYTATLPDGFAESGRYTIGNAYLVDESKANTGEVFCFYFNYGVDHIRLDASAFSEGMHTLAVNVVDAEVKTLDPKYLPEISSFVTIDLADYGIDLSSFMTSYGYQTGEVDGVGIFDALSDAYKSGKSVRLRQNVLGWLATDIGTMMTDGEGNVTLAMGTVLAWMNTSFDEIYVALSKGDGKTTIAVQHNYVPVIEPEA